MVPARLLLVSTVSLREPVQWKGNHSHGLGGTSLDCFFPLNVLSPSWQGPEALFLQSGIGCCLKWLNVCGAKVLSIA